MLGVKRVLCCGVLFVFNKGHTALKAQTFTFPISCSTLIWPSHAFTPRKDGKQGDDCISIVGNSSSILIKNTVCGPGHGISIGSLGKNKTNDQVQDVLVDEAFISNTDNGVRIKTWQGGQGHACNIIFRNISMRNVSNPIIVDQYYCDSSLPCNNQTSAVKVEKVAFIDIKGTSATQEAIKLACSDSYACKKILLKNIELSSYSGGDVAAYCWKASGFSSGVVYPPPCLSDSDQLIQKITPSSLPLYSSA